MVAAFGSAPGTDVVQIDRQRVLESLVTEPLLASPETTQSEFVREERIRPGDSVPALLGRLGLDDALTFNFLRGDKTAQVIHRQLSPGKTVTAHLNPSGKLIRLLFPLNGPSDHVLVVEQTDDGGLTSKIDTLKLETRVVMKSAEIRYSLFGATDSAGIPDGIATQMADIYGGDIDFHRDLRKGDRFAVVYESVTHLGKEIRSGKLLAAEFVNNGKSYKAAWFPAKGTEGGYYSAEGKSLRKAFLRSPLEFSRITSGFSTARFHPVLQKWRAHKGIDYGAPTGTRVRATSTGVIEFVGIRGGYGKVVVLRHQGRYTTLYAHLSGFSPGLRPGSRLNQGDTVGYVGATGLASGPHLHYEFQINGIHQNPLAMALPSAPPLAANQLPEFQRYVAPHFAQIDRIRQEDTKLALVN
jgi:murein DD-endopeptidase MepM/ murein hydrolase activator NlpD